MSELLVASVEAVTAVLGLTPFFVGIIIVPIIGNVAEHLASVQAARQNKMDPSLSIAVQSAGADRTHGSVHDLGPGLSGRRVQLAGGGDVARCIRYPGAGILLLAIEALTNQETR